jgi:hypothetical protein
MSRRRAGRASVDEVLAQAEEAPVEAAVEVPSSRPRRRQVNFDAEDSADAAGIGALAQEVAPEGGTAIRRSRFQPSAEKQSDVTEDVSNDGQSDIQPQELAQILRSKSESDRSQTSIIEISIPSARVNTDEDPPLQLLHIKKNDFANQVSVYVSQCQNVHCVTFVSGASQRAVLCYT